MVLLGCGLLALLAVVVIFAVTPLVRRWSRRRANAAALAIRTADGIQEAMFLSLGGIDQWISIRGEDRANPVILVLHGGPATSYMAFAPLFQAWERLFTVVQWDRRGVGRTFGRNGRSGSGEMTLERITADGLELAQFLLGHLCHPKIILLGHSMGSMIGICMASRRPDLFDAYVGTEQIINMARNETISYQAILGQVRKLGRSTEIKALERIGPPPYASALTWGTKQRAAEAADPGYGELARQIRHMIWHSPAYGLQDILDLLRGSIFCLSKLYPQWMSFDAYRLGAGFSVPVLIIQGATDVMTPTELAADWLRKH